MNNISSPLFQNLDETEIKQIKAFSRMRKSSYMKGDLIFRTGDIVCEIGIVQKGSVNIENTDLWGNRSILSNLSEGQVFAETYALCHEPMMVDAVAADFCEILFLNFNMLMEKQNIGQSWYSKILNNMLQVSVQKNLLLSNRIFCTTAKTIRGRLLTYLSSVSVKNGSTTFQVPFDRQQMADYLNLDRSALSKELGRMRDDGLIEFYKNTFKLKLSVDDNL